MSKIVVMVVQPCGFTKEHWLLPFMWVNSMVHELYLNKTKTERIKLESKLSFSFLKKLHLKRILRLQKIVRFTNYHHFCLF